MSALVKSEKKDEGHQNKPSTVNEAKYLYSPRRMFKILLLRTRHFMKHTDLSQFEFLFYYPAYKFDLESIVDFLRRVCL